MDKTELKLQLVEVKELLVSMKSASMFEQPVIARLLMAKTLVILAEIIERMPDDGE